MGVSVMVDQIYKFCMDFRALQGRDAVPLHIIAQKFGKRAKLAGHALIDLIEADGRFRTNMNARGGYLISPLNKVEQERLASYKELRKELFAPLDGQSES